jgi:hypothetical protein
MKRRIRDALIRRATRYALGYAWRVAVYYGRTSRRRRLARGRAAYRLLRGDSVVYGVSVSPETIRFSDGTTRALLAHCRFEGVYGLHGAVVAGAEER